MIVENLEVIFISNAQKMNDDDPTSSPNNHSSVFFNPEVRKIMGRAVQCIILEKEINHHNLLQKIMGLKKDDYVKYSASKDDFFKKRKKLIEEGLEIIEQFSVAKKVGDYGGKWVLKKEEWEQEYIRSYQLLHNKFNSTLQKLKSSSVYRCSKKCMNKLYSAKCAIKNHQKCYNGHRLTFLSKEEKDKLIKDFEHDIETLEKVCTPLNIVDQINIKYGQRITKEPELPVFSYNDNFLFMHSHIASTVQCMYLNFHKGVL